MLKKLIVTAAVVGALSAAGCAADPAESQYEVKRVGGPRNDIYVLVPAEEGEPAAPPYALTGREERKPERRVVQRWAGTHYIGPAYEPERPND